MHHFIVLMWDPAEHLATHSAGQLRSQLQSRTKGWMCVLDQPGLFAVHQPSDAGCQVYVFPDKTGVVFGNLFRSETHVAPVLLEDLPKDLGSTLYSSRGRSLTDNFWGYYAAFFCDLTERYIYAVRDCSGKIPCFLSERTGVRVFFSHFDDAVRLSILPPLTINWTLLTNWLRGIDPHTSECGFDQVTQLLAGECFASHRGTVSRGFAWDPRTIWNRQHFGDYNDARIELARVTKWCIQAHALVDRRILLQVSGGFDSAVVLGCTQELADPPFVQCLNRFASGPEEDERHFARAVTTAAKVKLIESDWKDSGVGFDSRLLEAPMMARPTLRLVTRPEYLFRSKIAQEMGATTIWSGEGGDHLFIRGLNVRFAADYARDHPHSLGILKQVRDNARYSRVSYWSVAKDAIRPFRMIEPPENGPQRQISFLTAEAMLAASADEPLQPWRQSLAQIPQGKRWQVVEYQDLLNRGATMIDMAVYDNPPLLSQPLLELCLQIPTYILIKGGQHRALARDAFANVIPPEIKSRESKGGTASVVAGLFAKHRAFVRDLLLDGVLAKRGVLSRQLLDDATTPGKPLALINLFPLMSALSAEVWVRIAEKSCQESSEKRVSLQLP